MTGASANTLPINDVRFSLPAQVRWVQSKNQRNTGNIVAEWRVDNHSIKTTPMLIAYQRMADLQSPKALLQQLTAPYQQHCADHRITSLNVTSRYPNSYGVEILCSQFQQQPYGLVIQVLLFSDTQANHLLLGEVKTPPSAKAGQLAFRNPEEKRLAELSQQRFTAISQMMQSTQVCDVQKRCY